MENSYIKNTNSRLPFGVSAPTHNAAFSSPPPPIGQLAEPPIRAGPRSNYSYVYASDHSLLNTFGPTPIAPRQLDGLPQRMPLAPVAQFQPSLSSNVGGEFRPSSWHINANVPTLPVNVNVPPPLSANVNVPPPPINTNVPPPGFNPRIPPPPIFSPQRLPPVATTSASALAGRPALLSSAQWASSFTDRTCITSARQPTFGIRPPPVPAFVSCQRMPANNRNENSGSTVQCRPVQQSVCGPVSSEGTLQHLPSAYSSTADVCESSAILSDKHDSVEKSHESSSLLLSAADANACPSVGATAVVCTTLDNVVSDSRRRRTSTRNCITVSCHLL